MRFIISNKDHGGAEVCFSIFTCFSDLAINYKRNDSKVSSQALIVAVIEANTIQGGM